MDDRVKGMGGWQWMKGLIMDGQMKRLKVMDGCKGSKEMDGWVNKKCLN